MTDAELLNKIDLLDDDSKSEVINYIDFLLNKKKGAKKKHPKAGFLSKNTFLLKEGFDDIPDCFKGYL